MRYEVRFRLAGEEHAEQLDASDAAAAAQSIHETYGRTPELFELLSVNLLDDPHAGEGDVRPTEGARAKG